jgi:histidine triad (HIT) family protein
MTQHSDCIFCRIAAGTLPARIVYADDKVLAFHDLYPKADTHLLLIPRLHLVSLEDLQPEHDHLVSHMLRLLPQLAQQQGLDSGFRTIINTGAGGGQVIFHLHIHLLGGPRLAGF